MLSTFISMVKENWVVFVIMGCFFIILFTVTEIARRSERKKEQEKKLASEQAGQSHRSV